MESQKSKVKSQNLIDRCITVLYYSLFFFAPLIMASVTSELFEFNKMIFIYIISSLVLFIWVLKMIYYKKIILKKTPFDIPLLLFIGSQIVSTVFSIDRHTSIFGYYGRFNGGLLSLAAYAILYFAFTANALPIKKILKVSLISSFLVILWGLPGKFGYDLSCFVFMGQLNNACWTDQFHPSERMFSTLGQPNWLGAYLLINFFFAVYFFITEKSKKILYVLYLFLNGLAIWFTGSRSSLIALIIGNIMFGFFYFHIKKPAFINKKLVIKLTSLFILLIFFVSFLTLNQNKLNKIRSSLERKLLLFQGKNPGDYLLKERVTESLDIRAIVWGGAVKLGLSYPLFGTGVETFAYAYYFVRPIVHNMTSEWDYLYNKAHNEYLNYVATTGYVGISMYLIMIGSFVFLTIKTIMKYYQEKDTVFLLLGLLLSYASILITNFFGFSTTTINLFFYLIPAIVMRHYLERTEQKEIKEREVQSISTLQWMYITISTIVTLFLLIFFMNYFLADVTYAKADRYSKTGDYQTSATLLTQALKLKYEHVYEDKLSYVLANLAVVASYQKQDELAKQLVSLAENYNSKSLKASPKNVLYWKTRAKNEYLFYQISLDRKKIEAGVTALMAVQSLSPTDPKIPYSLAIFYSLLHDEEKNGEKKELFKTESLKEIEKSIELKPDYRDSYLLKGQLLKKYNQTKEARKAFEYILKNLNPKDADAKKELQSL